MESHLFFVREQGQVSAPGDIASYQLLADLVLALHVAIVAFVIGGPVAVIAGNLFRWRWVNALWFRLAHLGAIATRRSSADR